MPAPVRAALEARIAAPPDRAQDRETLRLEQETPGRPGRSGGRQLTIHEQEGPPRQRATGNGKRDTWQWCVVQIRLEQFRSRCRRLVHRRKPALKLPFPVSRFPFLELREPDLPQLEICRLGQGDAEPRVFPRGEREVGQRRARW